MRAGALNDNACSQKGEAAQISLYFPLGTHKYLALKELRLATIALDTDSLQPLQTKLKSGRGTAEQKDTCPKATTESLRAP